MLFWRNPFNHTQTIHGIPHVDESKQVHCSAWPISSEGVPFLGQVLSEVMWRGRIGGLNSLMIAEEANEGLLLVM